MRKRRINTKETNTNLSLDFDKSQFVEPELQDKISLWMLRIIINLGGHREFIDKDNGFRREEVAYFLGLIDDPEQSRNAALVQLKNDLTLLENKKDISTAPTLKNNIKNISKLMNLNVVEEQILEFVVLLNQYEVLNDTADFLGRELNSSQVYRVFSVILT